MRAPWPIIEVHVVSQAKGALEAFADLDARSRRWGVRTWPDKDGAVVGGQSEDAVSRAIAWLRKRLGDEMIVGAPQVAYRETITRRAQIEATHASGGAGESAKLLLEFEPGKPGSGYQFESRISDRAILGKHVAAVRRALKAAQQAGLLAGFPVIDFKATLVGGARHDLDSDAASFEATARSAFRQLREEGEPVLLEPVMRVEVTTPEDCFGDVIGDLNVRRGQIQVSDQAASRRVASDQVALARVPLSNMFGYANTLRAMTGGVAHFRMEFDHHQPIPQMPDPVDDPRFPGAMAMRVGAGGRSNVVAFSRRA